MKRLALVFLAVMIFFPAQSFAQEKFSDAELDTLVAPIALYPDPLLVQVLTASTYGNQLSAAYAWAEGHSDMKPETLARVITASQLPYDASVIALLPFPSVLGMMERYPTWTDQLGDAVTIQKNDVLDAVQRMRRAAYNHGQLKANDNITISVGESQNIVINPVRTEYIVVPVYNPRVVYYVDAEDGVVRISYNRGVWVGSYFEEWGWGNCWFDWSPRVIYVRNYRWYPHRPIPHYHRPHNPPPPPRDRYEPPRHQDPPHKNHHNPPPPSKQWNDRSHGYSISGNPSHREEPARRDDRKNERKEGLAKTLKTRVDKEPNVKAPIAKRSEDTRYQPAPPPRKEKVEERSKDREERRDDRREDRYEEKRNDSKGSHSGNAGRRIGGSHGRF